MENHLEGKQSLLLRVYPDGAIEVCEGDRLKQKIWERDLLSSLEHKPHEHPSSKEDYWGDLTTTTQSDDREDDLWDFDSA